MAELNLQETFDAVAGELDGINLEIESIKDDITASQIWLSAVEEEAELPSAYGTPAEFIRTKTYLCRVTSENNVYQCVARETGDPEWLLYSHNTDYIDEQELAAAIAAEEAAREEADELKVNKATAATEIMVNWR